MKLDSMEKLFEEEITDLYSAEHMNIEALKKASGEADSPDLKKAFRDHLEQTKGHVRRLEEVFGELGKEPKQKKCKAMEGLTKEAEDILKGTGDPAVKDAALIAAAQKIEHYEIASYGCARTYAQILGFEKAAKLLQTTLDEEGKTNEKLTKLAERDINQEAVQA